MARDRFHMTLSNLNTIDQASGPDIPDVLATLDAVQVSVFARGTTNPVTIYQRPTGAAQGPTPESGATGGPNPFTTGLTGDIEFWADGPTELDVFIHDTKAPSRISDRTFGWNPMPATAASLPTAMLAKDGGITLASLAADILRQLKPIGEVIDWWRPDATVPLPSGFEVCDGRSIPAGSHDFPVAGAVALPNLINQFILGADPTKAHAAGAAANDLATGGPGIAGTGGSQNNTLTVAQLPSHAHGAGSLATDVAPAHGHSMQSNNQGGPPVIITGGQVSASHGGVAVNGPAVQRGGDAGFYGGFGVANGGAHSHDVTGSDAAVGGGTSHNNMPRFVGLLRLMKVRRS